MLVLYCLARLGDISPVWGKDNFSLAVNKFTFNFWV